MLNVGDKVTLTQTTLMDDAGAVGIVTRKYAPLHCTGVWSVTVRWEGNTHETSYPYPTGGMVTKVEG